MVEVLPIPPAPIRAIGVRCSVNPTIFSINSSRPKKTLGGGGGGSAGTLDPNIRGGIYWWSRSLTCFESRKRSGFILRCRNSERHLQPDIDRL